MRKKNNEDWNTLLINRMRYVEYKKLLTYFKY